MGKKQKPAKPFRDFPLFPHATGRWAKKIRGKLHYFGSWDDGWEAALKRYDAEKADLYAGLVPHRINGLRMRKLCTLFLAAKKQQVDNGELRMRTFRELSEVCDMMDAALGSTAVVDALVPQDFDRLRKTLGKNCTAQVLAVRMSRARSVFRWAVDSEHVAAFPRMGRSFDAPTRKVIRREESTRGALEFTASEIRSLVNGAKGVQLPAMILLAINTGIGNRDCSEMDQRHLWLDQGWMVFPRPKTGVQREAKLWTETVEALRLAIANRPKPRTREHSNRVFLTRCGLEWCRDYTTYSDDAIAKAFRNLCGDLGLHKKGRGFYTLRRTYRTVADECGDMAAIDLTMGHECQSMGARYRQSMKPERLERVADTVHQWLYADHSI